MVYGFYFNWSCFESSYALISLHYTAKGAYQAMKEHRLKIFNEWRALPRHYRQDYKDTFDHDWRVMKIQIED